MSILGPRERKIEPCPVSQNVVEKSKFDDERKKIGIGGVLWETRGIPLQVLEISDLDNLRASLKRKNHVSLSQLQRSG